MAQLIASRRSAPLPALGHRAQASHSHARRSAIRIVPAVPPNGHRSGEDPRDGFFRWRSPSSTLGTHFDAGNPSTGNPNYHASSRPDFLILCYPVISLVADYTHTGSRENLLGKRPEPELVRSLSNEFQVTSETPPTFLFHTDEDAAVPPMNSIVFYEALKRAGVPAELHIYRQGGHGLGLAHDVPGTKDWPNRCREWLMESSLRE